MGLFSWECKGCGHSMLSGMATYEGTAWMSEVVVQAADGTRLVGRYDGYGRVNGTEMPDYIDGEACCHHKACWEILGKPDYDGPSEHSEDQGYVDKDYDHEKPTGQIDLTNLQRERRGHE